MGLQTPNLPDEDQWERRRQPSLFDYILDDQCHFDRPFRNSELELPELPDEDQWETQYSYSTTTSSTSVIPYTTPSRPAGSGQMEHWSPSWGLRKRARYNLSDDKYSKHERPENKYYKHVRRAKWRSR